MVIEKIAIEAPSKVPTQRFQLEWSQGSQLAPYGFGTYWGLTVHRASHAIQAVRPLFDTLRCFVQVFVFLQGALSRYLLGYMTNRLVTQSIAI